MSKIAMQQKHHTDEQLLGKLRASRPTSKNRKSLYLVLSLLICSSLWYLRIFCISSDYLVSPVIMNSRIFTWLVNLLLPLRLAAVVQAVTYEPLQPPSYPLAVRNPYLSSMLQLLPHQETRTHAG